VNVDYGAHPPLQHNSHLHSMWSERTSVPDHRLASADDKIYNKAILESQGAEGIGGPADKQPVGGVILRPCAALRSGLAHGEAR
jgi:hypothetical protein